MHKSSVLLVIGGILAGLVNGVLGGGAGVIVVLMLLSVCKLSQCRAQATALLVVLPMATLSSILYVIKGSLPLVPTIIVTVFATVGGVLGALILGRVDNKIVKCIFAVLLIVGGLQMIVGAL